MAYPPTTNGSYGRKAGKEGGRLDSRKNKGRFQNSLQVKLFGLLFCLLSLQCYCSNRNAFHSAFSSNAYFKVCFEAENIW